jgi:hypothetical protein
MAELIERFEPALLQRYDDRLLPSQRQALAAMKCCRSSFAPRMLALCEACGEQRSVPHSCGHRACPHCQHHEGQLWLQRQLELQVPATYFLITFTLPAELRGLAFSHQRVVYALLMQCAWETLATFSNNDTQLRAAPGAVGVLHTHRALQLHIISTWRAGSRRPDLRDWAAAATRAGLPLQPQGPGQVFRGKLLAP